MGQTYQRLQKVFTIFGILVFCFSLWEFFRGVYPQTQGLIFLSSGIAWDFIDFRPRNE